MARRRPASKAAASPNEAASEPAQPASGPLGKARSARARGDFRQLRQEARSALTGSAAPEVKSEAQRLLDDSRPDPVALLTALAVFAVIATAAWVALLHHH